MKRKFKLTVTKVRRQTVTVPSKTFRAVCPVCQSEVEIISVAEAAVILEVEEQTLETIVAVGEVHAVQTVSGNLWICKDSLFQTRG